MLRIYGYAGSINVRKVLWACVELDLAFEPEDWGGSHRPISEPLFRALNPVAMVPVIDDAGTIVWESNAIIRYLAASRDRYDLLPGDPAARARVEMWMDWQVSDFNNSWRVAFQGWCKRIQSIRIPPRSNGRLLHSRAWSQSSMANSPNRAALSAVPISRSPISRSGSPFIAGGRCQARNHSSTISRSITTASAKGQDFAHMAGMAGHKPPLHARRRVRDPSPHAADSAQAWRMVAI